MAEAYTTETANRKAAAEAAAATAAAAAAATVAAAVAAGGAAPPSAPATTPPVASHAATGGGSGAGDSDLLSSLVLSMGMGGLLHNPITRASAGAAFYGELARQVAVFIAPFLERCGGLMPLTDAYCLYNRARRTDLVSPEDLLEAAALLERLGLGVRLGKLQPGGLPVLQLASFSPAATGARLAELLGKRAAAAGTAGAPSSLPTGGLAGDPFLTALEVNKEWRVPLPVARQLLLVSVRGGKGGGGGAVLRLLCPACHPFNYANLPNPYPNPNLRPPQAAETQGRLCRDDSVNGLRFYLNRFAG
jgi:hypothetical protein